MSSHIEDDLARALGRARPRGQGFSERMAAGAQEKIMAKRAGKHIVLLASAAAVAVVLALVWFLPTGGSNQPITASPVTEQSAPDEPRPAGGNTAAPSGPVLLVFDVQPEGEAFVDGASMGSTRKPIEVPPGAHAISVKIAGEVKVQWSGQLLPGQWKRFSYMATNAGLERPIPEQFDSAKNTCDEVTCLVNPDNACCRRLGKAAISTEMPQTLKNPFGESPPRRERLREPNVKRPFDSSADRCDEITCLVEPGNACCKRFRKTKKRREPVKDPFQGLE